MILTRISLNITKDSFNTVLKRFLSTGRSLAEGNNEDQDTSTVNPAVAQAIAGIPVDQVNICLCIQ